MDITSYIKSQLNDEQGEAALHIDTSSLIIAGAGSGKTRTLIYKIAYLIRGKHIPVQKILAVTFTNKAANEMKERLLKISEEISSGTRDADRGTKDSIQSSWANAKDLDSSLRSEWQYLDDSLGDFLNAMQSSAPANTSANRLLPHTLKWIWTFHSIFLKILKEDIEKLWMKYTKNFGIYDSNESQSIMKDVLKRLWLQDIYKIPEAKVFISIQKNNWLDPKGAIKILKTDHDQSMYKIYEEYQKELENNNSLDFDDLLLLPYLLFKKNPVILKKRNDHFDYILVDEAQDTNRIQFELMKMLGGENANMTLIGDDYQSIYGWRGALMENFLNVKKYRPDIQMFKLQINYRSRPHIVHAGNQIIKNNVNQYEKNIVAHRTGDDKITIFSHASEMDEAANIVDLIKKMKDQGKVKNRSQVAILYRTNAQSSPFEQLFLQEGIPYKVWWAYKFFERKEIKDTLSYIKYILNPQDNISLKRILNVPTRKIWKTTIETIEELAIDQNTNMHEILIHISDLGVKLTPAATKWIEEFLTTMIGIRTQLKKLTPAELIETLIKKIKYRDYLVKEEWGEPQADEKYENIWQLINMAQKYDLRKTANEEPWSIVWEELLRQFMEEVALLSDISENESWEIEAVKLMTAHSSKGLEFPIVFIVGLEDYIFPLANAMQDPKTLEEERRLMYVAVTRAKDVLFLSHAHSRMTRWQTKMNPPSRFLDEISPDLVKRYDLGGWWTDDEPRQNVDEWDSVMHKLFGKGYVLEVWNNLTIVKFHNPKFGVRKIEMRFLQVIWKDE